MLSNRLSRDLETKSDAKTSNHLVNLHWYTRLAGTLMIAKCSGILVYYRGFILQDVQNLRNALDPWMSWISTMSHKTKVRSLCQGLSKTRWIYAVWCRYNTVRLIQNPQQGYPIIQPQCPITVAFKLCNPIWLRCRGAGAGVGNFRTGFKTETHPISSSCLK